MDDFTQDIAYVQHPDGSITATLTVTFADGRQQRYSASVDAQQMEDFNRTIAIAEKSGPIAGGCVEIGVTAPGARDWWWRAAAAVAKGFSPTDRSARAMAAQEKWWLKEKNADQRENDRAAFLGITANPAYLKDPAAGNRWWGSLSAERRVQIRHRYRSGVHDVARAAKKVGEVALQAAPIVLTAVPGIGLALGPAAAAGLAIARKVASSKVASVASKALAAAAPSLGGASGAARKASASLGASSKLIAADIAQAAGATKATAKLVEAAKKAAAAAPGALAHANKTRKNVARVAARPSSKELIAAAKAGRVHSSKGGSVNAAQLSSAANAGRVYYVS